MNVFDFATRFIDLVNRSGLCDYDGYDEIMAGFALTFQQMADNEYDDVLAALHYLVDDEERPEIVEAGTALIDEVERLKADWE